MLRCTPELCGGLRLMAVHGVFIYLQSSFTSHQKFPPSFATAAFSIISMKYCENQ